MIQNKFQNFWSKSQPAVAQTARCMIASSIIPKKYAMWVSLLTGASLKSFVLKQSKRQNGESKAATITKSSISYEKPAITALVSYVVNSNTLFYITSLLLPTYNRKTKIRTGFGKLLHAVVTSGAITGIELYYSLLSPTNMPLPTDVQTTDSTLNTSENEIEVSRGVSPSTSTITPEVD